MDTGQRKQVLGQVLLWKPDPLPLPHTQDNTLPASKGSSSLGPNRQIKQLRI